LPSFTVYNFVGTR